MKKEEAVRFLLLILWAFWFRSIPSFYPVRLTIWVISRVCPLNLLLVVFTALLDFTLLLEWRECDTISVVFQTSSFMFCGKTQDTFDNRSVVYLPLPLPCPVVLWGTAMEEV